MAEHCSPGPEPAPDGEEENVEQQKLELEALLSIYPEEIATVKEAAEYLVYSKLASFPGLPLLKTPPCLCNYNYANSFCDLLL